MTHLDSNRERRGGAETPLRSSGIGKRDDRRPWFGRRQLLSGAGLGVAGAFGLGGCAPASSPEAPFSPSPTPTSGATARFELRAGLAAVDLGGVTYDAWCYDGQAPGPTYRVGAGDLVKVAVTNTLPEDTTVHWHGVRVPNAMDGVPGVTQDPIAPGGTFDYSFIAPDPGTYFFHSHVGLQLDRAMAGVLVVEDPNDQTQADHDWVVVIDDWVDGTGATPAEELEALERRAETERTMMGSGLDLEYPHYVINGKLSTDPVSFGAKPGERARIRLVNASADTTYRVALTDHVMTATHKDGVPCQPTEVDCVLISMGERYDIEVTMGDGLFRMLAVPEGKPGVAMALVRTSRSAGEAWPDDLPAELNGRIMISSQLQGLESVDNYDAGDDEQARDIDVALSVRNGAYSWLINGQAFAEADPVLLAEGETIRLTMTNRSHSLHPMHLHGHSFRVNGLGSWHDTLLLGEMGSATVQFKANNPGQWAFHCHNIYHAEAGMMTLLNYSG